MHEQVSSSSRSRARARLQPVSTRQAASALSQRSRRQNPPTQRRSSLPQRPELTTPGPSLASLLQRHSVNILPTALVKLETGTQTFETAALIDPCTPMSCIDASLASAFKLPMTSVGEEKVCTTTIRSRVDAGTKLEVVLKIEASVRIRTPVRALSDTVVSKFRDIMLADDQFHRPATVSMVSGADVYPKVIQRFLGGSCPVPAACCRTYMLQPQ
ncbi:uncharacterized protein LOC122621631 [Drosophila teissieri]|uniref:uncharacterized protein LOC122621631 n=1 Tax=Drosophila teissieri TaxID=7243 RepID=UPI001CBA0816|nr:uncharacterized protein LOC122621631 [Drosophila teissieri]